MKLPFTKMHGAGNDFVVLDFTAKAFSLSGEVLRKIADRHLGVGCDQILVVERPRDTETDFRYRIFNAATNAAEATDEADDENYFAVLDQAGNAAEAAAAEITGYKTYADLLEALDTRRKQS